MRVRSGKRRAEPDDLILNRGHAKPRWFTSVDKFALSKAKKLKLIRFKKSSYEKMNSSVIISE